MSRLFAQSIDSISTSSSATLISLFEVHELTLRPFFISNKRTLQFVIGLTPFSIASSSLNRVHPFIKHILPPISQYNEPKYGILLSTSTYISNVSYSSTSSSSYASFVNVIFPLIKMSFLVLPCAT